MRLIFVFSLFFSSFRSRAFGLPMNRHRIYFVGAELTDTMTEATLD